MVKSKVLFLIKYKNIVIAQKPIQAIAKLYDEKRYFVVIILAPQVYEQMVLYIDKNAKDYLKHKIGESFFEEELEIRKYHKRLVQEESIKAQTVNCLIDMYFAEDGEFSINKKGFKKYFTKLENIVSLRNDLSHDFFKKNVSQIRIKRTAKECFDIIDILVNHPFQW